MSVSHLSLPAKEASDIHFDVFSVPTPSYVVDRDLLQANLNVLAAIRQQTGVKILLAQKAFSMYHLYPQIAAALDGSTASGLYEAKLGAECFPGETHVFSPAYRPDDMAELCALCDHMVFNSFEQWVRHRASVQSAARPPSVGIRINPQHSTQDTPLYDPCAPYSRLGVTVDQMRPDLLSEIEGLHFHCLCEQNVHDLISTLDVVEEAFGGWLPQMKWFNLGGGHHITRKGYDVQLLTDTLNRLQEQYDLQVYLEPGEAVVINTGFLVTEVMDSVNNQMEILILDASAECHMPDVLAMPYRPQVVAQKSGRTDFLPGEAPQIQPHTYRLSSCTCLAGDVVGDYSFAEPLRTGDRLIFFDMALYTMVKNNTFNGMPLPSILSFSQKDGPVLLRTFGYEDFKSRL
jgi:carboxynorspermidine decarboxylase